MRRILAFLSILLILSGCETPSSSSIHKYEYSDVIDKQISYLDVFKVNDDSYYIYYYQVDCYHCHGIKSKVIGYSLSTSVPFYFVEIKEDYGFLSHTKEDTLNTNDPMKAFALMTPQLSLVVKGYVKETYIGNDEILNIIE